MIDRLQFKDDYVGYLNRLRAHLYIYDIETKATVQITSGDYEDFDPTWSPDGSVIAFVSNRTDEPDANYNTDIWLVKPDVPYEEQTPVRVTTNPGSDERAHLAPRRREARLHHDDTTGPTSPGSTCRRNWRSSVLVKTSPLFYQEALDRKVYGSRISRPTETVSTLCSRMTARFIWPPCRSRMAA